MSFLFVGGQKCGLIFNYVSGQVGNAISNANRNASRLEFERLLVSHVNYIKITYNYVIY